jgi:hypothetical protein
MDPTAPTEIRDVSVRDENLALARKTAEDEGRLWMMNILEANRSMAEVLYYAKTTYDNYKGDHKWNFGYGISAQICKLFTF